jgi:hypothetical protein
LFSPRLFDNSFRRAGKLFAHERRIESEFSPVISLIVFQSMNFETYFSENRAIATLPHSETIMCRPVVDRRSSFQELPLHHHVVRPTMKRYSSSSVKGGPSDMKMMMPRDDSLFSLISLKRRAREVSVEDKRQAPSNDMLPFLRTPTKRPRLETPSCCSPPGHDGNYGRRIVQIDGPIPDTLLFPEL